jgi:Protein of unknown function (DUF2934)
MSARMSAIPRPAQQAPETNVEELVTGAETQSQSFGASIQEDIARLAYALWQQRGCPIGSAEFDWFEAEKKVRSAERRESTSTRR